MEQTAKPAFNILQFRVDGIMDRDAPTLYGFTPERTLADLWLDKAGSTDSTLEPEPDLFVEQATEIFREALKLPCLYPGFCINKAIPILRAEVMAPSTTDELIAKIVHQEQEAFDRVANELLPIRGGRVPERDWIEIQHQIMVTGAAKAYFVSTMSGQEISYVLVPHDPVFASNHTAECIIFWDSVRRGVPPAGVDLKSKDDAVLPETQENLNF